MPEWVRSNTPHYLVMRISDTWRYRERLADAMEGKHKQAGDKRMAVNTTKLTPNHYADELAPTSHTCAVRLRVREIMHSMQCVFLLRDPFSLNLLAAFRSWFITYV